MGHRVWTKEDIPLPAEMAEHLARVQAVRNVFPSLPGLPEVPPDMDRLNFEEANDIERLLLQVDRAITAIPQSRVYSGEFTSGGI